LDCSDSLLISSPQRRPGPASPARPLQWRHSTQHFGFIGYGFNEGGDFLYLSRCVGYLFHLGGYLALLAATSVMEAATSSTAAAIWWMLSVRLPTVLDILI
jgi:hypothetical protein